MADPTDPKLVKAFRNAALFLIDKIERGGWKKFSSNYLREHVRCRYGLEFGNEVSPLVLREVRKQCPQLAPYIDIKRLKRDYRKKPPTT
jgi:hypothetical protein